MRALQRFDLYRKALFWKSGDLCVGMCWINLDGRVECFRFFHLGLRRSCLGQVSFLVFSRFLLGLRAVPQSPSAKSIAAKRRPFSVWTQRMFRDVHNLVTLLEKRAHKTTLEFIWLRVLCWGGTYTYRRDFCLVLFLGTMGGRS